MITILVCADETVLQCRDALFDTMDALTEDDNIEFLFENPCLYQKKTLNKAYAALKDDSHFFKYPCKELYSGTLFQYLESKFQKNVPSHTHLFLIGASKEMLQTVIENYHQELNFTVKAFLKLGETWNWETIHNETELDKSNAGNKEIDLKRFLNQPLQAKVLKSPAQRKKEQKTTIIIIMVLLFLALLAFFSVRYFSAKRKEEAAQRAAELVAQIQPETISEEEILQQTEEIFKQYFTEEISYEDAVQAVNSLAETESEEISHLISDMTAILHSREAYQVGKEAMTSQNYQMAIDSFANVIEKDTNYYKLAQSESQLALSEYKSSQKKKAEELALSGNYGDAYLMLRETIQNFSDDDLFVGECMDKQKKYMDEWINAQRQSGNYFGENGAVMLAYSYQYFSMDGGLDGLLQEAYQYECERLINLLNAKRAELGYEPMINNDGLVIRAKGDAQLIKEKRYDEIYSDYNINYYCAKNAENVMEEQYVQLEGIGEFVENSKSIGVGILFDEEEMTCIWVVLTASETDI